MDMNKRILTAAALLCAGCASGFNRTQMQATLRDQEPAKGGYEVTVERPGSRVTANDIRRARELKPQLRFPFKLAVYLSSSAYQRDWRWSTKDQEMMGAWAETLKKRGIIQVRRRCAASDSRRRRD
jgi:uncharacterized lipoprotein YmbA